MKIVLTGQPHSKKNSRRNYGHTSLPSVAYLRFEEAALWQLLRYRIRSQFTGPVRIDYLFKQKGKMRQDIDNAICSINDVLQTAGVLADDTLVTEGSFRKIHNCPDWSTEVEITQLPSQEQIKLLVDKG